MKYREQANDLANEVARMAKGSLGGYPLEGAVSKIEKALDKARTDAFEELAKFCDGSKGYVGMGCYDDIAAFVRWYKEQEEEE